ncbi:peptidoglycan recognition family protein [Variovorax sp. J2P1-59]|uniref:peptidoglycan recognition protein family protein n=1 Tax=Variovorax flavidus TaxID=3053501 RepID=UPI0025769FD3|nr:peptidoglycan recognition family protein [Variovorax sp. J2P1-59]MDM0078262.1 peptidoglycan recognition family protein [Variovorax sp. J2P1-59]
MLYITRDGLVDAEKIKVKIFSTIEREKMDRINGIVIHQTDSPTAEATFNSYRNAGANGAHFLIEKDGTIYQTASLYRRANHVGKLKSRCLANHTCTPTDLKIVEQLRNKPTPLSRHEHAKPHPDRYPSNGDSIGIELVGMSLGPKDNKTYESVTDAQNASLKWLMKELSETLRISLREVFRHPEVAWKVKTEASTAKW